MDKISEPTEYEEILFAKPLPDKTMPGTVLRDLFDEFGIEGNFASDLAGYYLGYTRQAVQAMMSRTIRRNDYELLRHQLTFWRVHRMVEVDMVQRRSGFVGEDGERHHFADWFERQERELQKKREDIRKRRAKNPLYGRTKPGSGVKRKRDRITVAKNRELIRLRKLVQEKK